MNAPPFRLRWTDEAQANIEALKTSDAVRYKKVQKTLRHLTDAGSSYPGLHSHKYRSLRGPQAEDVWESYVENQTPGAWRVFWVYGPLVVELTIVAVVAHP